MLLLPRCCAGALSGRRWVVGSMGRWLCAFAASGEGQSGAGGPGMRSPARSRGRPPRGAIDHLINTTAPHHPRCDREWGLRPHARTTCPAAAKRREHAHRCFLYASRERHLQDGGGACGRRPHSRSHLGWHSTLVLMRPRVASLGGRPRDRAGERRRRRRPDARSFVWGNWEERHQKFPRNQSLARPKRVLTDPACCAAR